MNVLIVDDNAKIRSLLREYLPASASDVYECSDGGDAVGLYREHRPDWVLMDQDMPIVDGISTIREIITEFPKANICMVTAFDDEDLRTDAFVAGASGFVSKDSLYEIEGILVSDLAH